MKARVTFPIIVKQDGVSAKIRRTIKLKNGHEYIAYVVDYTLLGKRKLEWRADLDEAKQAAADACQKIADGEHMALQLKNGDRMTYLRATEALAPLNTDLDTACREIACATGALRATPYGLSLDRVTDRRIFAFIDKAGRHFLHFSAFLARSK